MLRSQQASNAHKAKSNITNIKTFVPMKGSLTISGIFLLAGCLWILLTDHAVSLFTDNVELIVKINMIKGWFFVLLTSLLFFFLTYSIFRRIKLTEEKLTLSYNDLLDAHERLESAHEEIIATEEELREQYERVSSNQLKLEENEERMHYLAHHDPLTTLPNKLDLYENGKSILEKTTGYTAVMFADIDNFKYINDTLGHEFGDRLIAKASERLVAIVRNQGVVYRFGGDEFIILFHSLNDIANVNDIAAYILERFKEAINLDNSRLHTTLSMGISIYPDHGDDIMELVKQADIAMYKAKEAGKSSFVIFNDPLKDMFTERMNIEKLLYTAMEENQFELFYQPQVDLKLNKVTGLEALLRWNSPELGQVSPQKFIKVAEDSHVIIPLGGWVMRSACLFLKRLHDKGFCHLTMSVNISMLQLLQSDFNEMVVETLQASGMQPDYLELEITESVLVESYDCAKDKLNELRANNIKIALDDFGTGYSSLSTLTHLPISTLKIDKSFIDPITEHTNQAILVEQILMIGKKMNMCVIAEGVEREEQLVYLQQHGCDKIQGYLYSEPLSAYDMEQLLAKLA